MLAVTTSLIKNTQNKKKTTNNNTQTAMFSSNPAVNSQVFLIKLAIEPVWTFRFVESFPKRKPSLLRPIMESG